MKKGVVVDVQTIVNAVKLVEEGKILVVARTPDDIPKMLDNAHVIFMTLHADLLPTGPEEKR